jgi:hypothetical protein
METRQVTKHRQTITYGIEGNQVVIFDPRTGREAARIPLDQPPAEFEKPESVGGSSAESWDDFQNCMRGCYDPSEGNPWKLAGCIALCSTIIS